MRLTNRLYEIHEFMFTATRIFIHMQYYSGTIFIVDTLNRGHLCIKDNVNGPSYI